MIAPAFPAFNIYSRVARHTTALGPLAVATVVDRTDGWCAEVVDENANETDAAAQPQAPSA